MCVSAGPNGRTPNGSVQKSERSPWPVRAAGRRHSPRAQARPWRRQRVGRQRVAWRIGPRASRSRLRRGLHGRLLCRRALHHAGGFCCFFFSASSCLATDSSPSSIATRLRRSATSSLAPGDVDAGSWRKARVPPALRPISLPPPLPLPPVPMSLLSPPSETLFPFCLCRCRRRNCRRRRRRRRRCVAACSAVTYSP